VLRSRQNPRVQAARKLARDASQARREGLFVAEGAVLVRDALEAGLAPRLVLFDPGDEEASSLLPRAGRRASSFLEAHPSVIAAVSTLASAPPALGIFERPHHEWRTLLGAASSEAPPLVAVLHGLQDPANAGSLVRSALAMGLNGVVSTAGTVDLFHPRAVRGAMGASFRLPVAVDLDPPVVWETLHRSGYRLIALTPRGGTSLGDVRLDQATAVVLGQEGGGLDAAARAACSLAVRIPMAGGVESLGVASAGAIVFYALRSARS
jgi:TrmH family RNA methyltransferase